MDRRVEAVTAYMVANLQHELSLDTLAKLINLSPSRLRHLFKAEVGITVAQHLKVLRLHKSKTLLETTFLSVKEIMYEVGLSHPNHFAQEFKKLFGLAPIHYRAYFHETSKMHQERNHKPKDTLIIKDNYVNF